MNKFLQLFLVCRRAVLPTSGHLSVKRPANSPSESDQQAYQHSLKCSCARRSTRAFCRIRVISEVAGSRELGVGVEYVLLDLSPNSSLTTQLRNNHTPATEADQSVSLDIPWYRVSSVTHWPQLQLRLTLLDGQSANSIRPGSSLAPGPG